MKIVKTNNALSLLSVEFTLFSSVWSVFFNDLHTDCRVIRRDHTDVPQSADQTVSASPGRKWNVCWRPAGERSQEPAACSRYHCYQSAQDRTADAVLQTTNSWAAFSADAITEAHHDVDKS